MSTPTINLEVASYMAAVRAELEDLEPDERDDLLDDLEQHLHEVAAEGDGRLADRLGSPAAYAAELRASAGLTSRSVRTPMRARFVRSVRAIPGVESLNTFLPEVRPGWWLLRGYLLVVAFDALFTHRTWHSFPFPSFGNSTLAGIVLVAVAMWGSVKLGRAAQRNDMARRAAIVLNIVVVAMAFFAIVAVKGYAGPGGAASVIQEVPSPLLSHSDGSPISNICAYTSDLKPVNGVLLFDQDGRAIDNVARPNVIDFSGDKPPVSGFANLYPRPQQVVDQQTGATKPFACPVLARPSPPPTEAPVP